MKKAIAIMCAVVLSLCCFACTSVKGSVQTCVEKAQDLSTNDTSTFEITGTVVSNGSKTKTVTNIITLSSQEIYGGYMAMCMFNDGDEIKSYGQGDRITIKGQIDSSYTDSNSIVLKNCKVVK